MLKLAICDWNRTLFKDYFEETFCIQVFKFVAIKAAKEFNIPRIITLITLALKTKQLVACAKRDKTINPIYELIELLNKDLFSKITTDDIAKLLEIYVKTGATKLDPRILKPLQSLKERESVRIGIISSGYRQGIKQILDKYGFSFDFIIANDFSSLINNKGVRFEFKITSNKADILKQILREEKVDKEDTMYIGDDSRDESCFQEVAFPVVSFLATAEDKQRFKELYNAFVPLDQYEFEKYLDRV